MVKYHPAKQPEFLNSEESTMILNSLQEHVIYYDQNMKILWANAAALNSANISPEELYDQPCWTVWCQREIPCDDCPVIKAMETGSVQSNEKTTSNGQSWFIKGYPLKDDFGNIIGAVETTLETTKRKRAEEKIKEQVFMLENLLFKAADGICVCHNIPAAPYVRFTIWNTRMHDITGYTIDEINELGWYQTLYPDPEIRQQAIDKMNQMREGDDLQSEAWLITTKSGEEKNISISASIVKKTQEKIHVLGIMKDISERKKEGKALQVSEEKYRTILESIEDGYYEVDIAGNFTFLNNSMTRILGYPPDELTGINNRKYMDAENAGKVFKAFNWVYKTKKPYKAFDWELIRKNGSRCYVETSVSLIIDSKGLPVGFQGIARDVTERKKFEKKNAKLERQLRQAEKVEVLGTLAAGVAHDLNNILSGIVGYPDLLLMKLPKDSPLRKPIINIQESGQKAAAVVRDLLTLARRDITDYKALNLNAIISEYLESPEYEKLKSLYPDVELKTSLDAGLLNIFGSPIHMSKVVMNLIANSAEAIGKHGKISITTENQYIDRPVNGYETIEEGDYVALIVSDSGIGIAPEDLKKIFEPFYTKKKLGISGTGLGMAVVRGTVKDHNGYIDVQSTEGQGTTFTILLPATRQELAPDQVDLFIEDFKGKGQRILVIDDVKEQRELTSVMLATLGYLEFSVASGEEAVEFLQNNSVDLLILDMIMSPGMDGLDTYKRILQLHPKQKAVIASGFSETDRVRKTQRLGAGQYIKKPYTLEKIGLAVKEELEN